MPSPSTRTRSLESAVEALTRMLLGDGRPLTRSHAEFERSCYRKRREALERRKESVDQDWEALGLPSDPDSEVFEE